MYTWTVVQSKRWGVLLVCFECLSLGMILAESRHFRQFGYHLSSSSLVLGGLLITLGCVILLASTQSTYLLASVLVMYAVGLVVAILNFPLNYLRSDMLPVITWADSRLVHHLNPYTTMHVGQRLYDFPYLPGMLIAFLPASLAGIDPRWVTLGYLVGAALLVFNAARPSCRTQVAVSIGIFVLCPFLQYRHDLYLQPHWFAVTLAVSLMRRQRFVWAALVWGVSCAIYQLSWVIVPFFVLNALWRRGFKEVGKLLLAMLAGCLCFAGPFLPFAIRQVASNTVGQWSKLPHALADPINISFWLTYIVRPDQLRWVQAGVLVALFSFCIVRKRCGTLVDTLRYMAIALALFIPMNVLVDGYFYLTLLLVLLLYVCVANSWWSSPKSERFLLNAFS